MATLTTAEATSTAVRLVDIHKTYPAREPVHALRGVSLDLHAGSVTAIVGQSGSGKSTLLNCAAGLDTPSRGSVVVGGHDLTTLRPDDLTRFRREHVGFVFQAYNLIGHLTARENVRLPLVLAGRKVDAAWESALLEFLGVPELMDRLPGELSGGQAQRVAIARALITRPAVVFADEPTGALDSKTGAAVLQVLRDTARELRQTVVVVTHDAQVAAAAERVVVLADGLIVDRLEGPTAEQVTASLLTKGR
ncbi:ABC transporter ATP-binding protein [Cellulomonas xiejunii]|uniref:ABC transporter ATP-binding protein n=1 Tax=Cellulomonas xiejunii TaxID=2968083 RepID=A0ABY5KSM1_9CELL|nr:ABC transporter ATP-binding protein [Cellulomonas xiejunii]MCC2314878.1 ABC transporter ATP-binding protein [Cellulomonas xiejunii]MCC2322161.1 ABC transporter ATP-binding protein [Cellulomonas xiejunii]MCC2323196.1 ABC transporter ATP-binding protein [Cellulomonas xiejunii]UUI72217.1 ABC transporter ATP-binding protein [Cellulomonas xiejunii]